MCFSELLEMLRSNLEMSHSHAVTIFCKKFQLTLLWCLRKFHNYVAELDGKWFYVAVWKLLTFCPAFSFIQPASDQCSFDPSTWCVKAFSRVGNLHGGSMNSSHQIRWTDTLKTSQEDLPVAGRPPAKPRLCPLLGIVASLLVHIQDLPSRVETSWRPGPLWSYKTYGAFSTRASIDEEKDDEWCSTLKP